MINAGHNPPTLSTALLAMVDLEILPFQIKPLPKQQIAKICIAKNLQRSEYPILSVWQGVHNEGGDLVHEIVRLSRMQHTREGPHLRVRVILELLVPIVHDAALPAVVRRIVRRDGNMEQPLRPLLRVSGHLD